MVKIEQMLRFIAFLVKYARNICVDEENVVFQLETLHLIIDDLTWKDYLIQTFDPNQISIFTSDNEVTVRFNKHVLPNLKEFLGFDLFAKSK